MRATEETSTDKFRTTSSAATKGASTWRSGAESASVSGRACKRSAAGFDCQRLAAPEAGGARLAEVGGRERNDDAREAVAPRRRVRLVAAVGRREQGHPLRRHRHVAQQQRHHAGADGAEAHQQQAARQARQDGRGGGELPSGARVERVR